MERFGRYTAVVFSAKTECTPIPFDCQGPNPLPVAAFLPSKAHITWQVVLLMPTPYLRRCQHGTSVQHATLTAGSFLLGRMWNRRSWTRSRQLVAPKKVD
mmetsp:Transcript_20206/g.55994  ORF Transcript_20206/g.55994 Transcript_20206/m.55994 type:complete len:100 (+) Transcript_20206:401-700(+)